MDIVQLRMKDAGDERDPRGRRGGSPRACAEHGALFILNDRPDLVAAAERRRRPRRARTTCRSAEARAVVGPERLVGLSTHSPEQIDAAAGLDVDYIGVGPVHATPDQAGAAGRGPRAGRATPPATPRVPFFAIGGISRRNVDAVRARRGARGSPWCGR